MSGENNEKSETLETGKSMNLLICLVICVVKYAWLEYCVHRFLMHKRGTSFFKSHTIEHHGKDGMSTEQASLTQNDVGIAFWYTLPITLTLSLLLGWVYLWTWAAVCFWAGFTWTAVHRKIHNEPGHKYAYFLCPWLKVVQKHHLLHHKKPKTRYGGLFWFLSDPFAGTWK